MSGICGLIHFDEQPVLPQTLRRMAEAAAHRGPDGITIWHEQRVALAHLALRITPESLREVQPLLEEDLVLVADARLDNREELTSRLSTKGYLREKDPTDAALILQAYRCWGLACAEHLLGDFAFALWDRARRRLYAARDAMAMRAFYYRVEAQRVLFATEVKQILAAPAVPVQIFEPAVAAYLAGCFNELEWTFYEGVTQLAPGHALVVEAPQGRAAARTWRYWDIDAGQRIRYRDEDQYAEHLRELFEEAVRCRLRSTRPVGLFLSGGMDSGSIASMAGHLMQQGETLCPSFHAYSYASAELPQCDERHISDGIARHYGFGVTPIWADDAWPLKDYPAHGPDRDEPHMSVYQTLFDQAMAAARGEGMGLVMSGDRGDWVIGGWILDHLGLLRSGQWRTLWNELRTYALQAGMPVTHVVRMTLLRPLLTSLQFRPETGAERRPGSSHYPAWIREEFARRVGLPEIIEQGRPRTDVKDPHRQRYQLIFSHASIRWVRRSERNQARFGLAFADPWSDRRITSFVVAAPQHVLHRAGDYKRIARRAMRGVMPEQVREAAGKIEPGSLFEQGLKEQAKVTVLDLITHSRASARGYVDDEVLQDRYAAFLRGEPQRYDLWGPLTLEMWLRRYWS